MNHIIATLRRDRKLREIGKAAVEACNSKVIDNQVEKFNRLVLEFIEEEDEL